MLLRDIVRGAALDYQRRTHVRTELTGNVSAGNRPQGGAVVTLTLPLSALTIDEQEIDEQRMDEADQKEGGYDH